MNFSFQEYANSFITMLPKIRRVFEIVLIITYIQSLECLTGSQKAELERLTFFDIELLRYSTEDRQGNVMVSPASIKSTLAMVLEGAQGTTEAEIRSALRLSPNKEEYRDQLNLYLKALKVNSTAIVLENANSVFVSKKLRLKKDYDIMLRNVYLSEISSVDFTDPIIASNFINNWVANKTHGLVPYIVEPVNIDPSSQILLTNALYFKGLWQHAFNPKLTRAMCFYDNGMCKMVAMMDLFAELKYAYVDNLRAHAVELPYVGGRYSMIVLVPQDRDGCSSLLRDLPYMSLTAICNLLEPTDVQLSMPKFTIDYSEDMVDPLRNMRIKSLFSSKSNLSGIFEGDSPQINGIFHKVHMIVDETGTVAAASTAAMVVPLISEGVQLRIDRPFIFFIRDNELGLVLFEGKIDEPTAYVAPTPTDTLKEKAFKESVNQTLFEKPQLIVKTKKRFGIFSF